MEKTNKITLLIATALLSMAMTLHAEQINGAITFGLGTVELDTASAGTATAVTAWHGAGGIGNPLVLSSDGDFAAFAPAGSDVIFAAPWNFASGLVASFWIAGGFTFNLTESHIFSQGGFPASVTVDGTGFVTGNGFEPRFGLWSFSTQDPSAGGLFSFSAAAMAVPEPTTVALLGLGLVGMGALRRTIRTAK